MPGPFHPLNINGEYAGKKSCLYCSAGDSPVVAVFARTADDATLQKLIGILETETVKNEKAEMTSFVVFCSDDEKLDGQAQGARREGQAQEGHPRDRGIAPARTSTTSARTPT